MPVILDKSCLGKTHFSITDWSKKPSPATIMTSVPLQDVDRLPSYWPKTAAGEISLLVLRLRASLKAFSFLVVGFGDLDTGVRDTRDCLGRSLFAMGVVILLVNRRGETVFMISRCYHA